MDTFYEVLGLLSQIHAEGRTVVLVTHEQEVAQAANRIVWVRDGRVQADEPAA